MKREIKIKRVSLDDYEKRESVGAAQSFADHRIVSRDARSWRCGSPRGSQFWFEAFVSCRLLTVVGDFDVTSFAFGYNDARASIGWIGGHDLDGYVLEKASIGTGFDVVRSFNADVWLDSALSEAETYHLGGETIDASKPVDLDALVARGVPVWLVDMIEDVALEGADASCLRNPLSEAIEAEAYKWGKVPASRVILAHAAVRRLHQLLLAEETSP